MEAMTRYLDSGHQDLGMMADDVVFTNMATGEEHRGVDGVRRMLDYVYHTAIEATAETRSRVYAESQAVLEADFVGTHIGEFAGIPATHRKVRVHLCVVYDLVAGKFMRGRVYLQMPVLLRQLGADSAPREAVKR
jgi:predicted ester cyclase